jgi:hypothetical protein
MPMTAPLFDGANVMSTVPKSSCRQQPTMFFLQSIAIINDNGMYFDQSQLHRVTILKLFEVDIPARIGNHVN